MIEVVLLSDAEIREASRSIEANPGISPDIRRAYRLARNRLFAPALTRIWADLPRELALKVMLQTRER